MAIQILNETNFKEFINENKGNILVDFYADWCGPCKMLSPVLEKISSENQDVEIVKVNVDESSNLAQEYGVVSIPTMVFLKDSEVSHVQVGLLPEGEILNLLK